MATKDREHIRKLREEANALRQKEEARKRRNRMFTQLGIVIGAIVVIAGIVLLVVFGPRWFGNENIPESSGTVAVSNSAGEQVEVPIVASESGIVVGNEDASNTIDFYFEYSCPHCVDYHAAIGGDIQQIIGDGDTKVNFHMIRYVSEYGLLAGATTAAVVQYQPELFFTVMDGLFAVPAEQQSTMTYGDYAAMLPAMGVTSEEAIEAAENGDYAAWLNNSTNDARGAGINGAPSVLVNGELQETLPASGDELRALVGASSAAPVETPAETAVETPAETTAQTPVETPAG
ncbi:MAG: thioredoxin domain-containing protein [Gulosibacter sp.]|uniref:thioredoxin domain-containing protein n=1 Tax=Gulosibacter sp. TaxID=2817531 RepID=UPI003F8E4C63